MKPKAPRIRMPKTAPLGDIIPIKTKIRHPMETGWRKDGEGKTIPRDRITHFVCRFNGELVIAADYASGVAADPYLLFHAKVTGDGTFTFRWEADGNETYTAEVPFSTGVGV